jgi:hypothetical protein
MAALNRLLVGTTDLLLAPLAHLPPLAGLAIVSLATAVALLLVIRKTSNQRRLASVKRSIQAGFFELRLFGDDVPAILRTERDMLRDTATYLRLSLVPVLWCIVPLTLLIAQLDCHFGYTGLAPGTPSLLTATLVGDAPVVGPAASASGGASSSAAATLEAPSSIRLETPAVSFPTVREVVWRITAGAPGSYVVRVHIANDVFDKSLQVSDAVERRSPVRLAGGFVDQLLNPSELPLPGGGPLKAIAVDYPRRNIRVLGWEVDWLVVYFVLSFGFMLALKRPLGVVL